MQEVIGAEGQVSKEILSIGIERKYIGSVKGPQGVEFKPSFEISGDLYFQPLGNHRAFFNGDIALRPQEINPPDFSMTSSEVAPVMRTMRKEGFEVGCLYNQETDESPQLYFAHMLAVGDPYVLARNIRRGLDYTDSD